MVAQRRKRNPEMAGDEILHREGFEELTRENADEQFAKLLGILGRMDDSLFETVVEMRRNRKLIDAGLERIARRGDEIDQALAETALG